MSLTLEANLEDPDAIYEKLIAMLESHEPEKALRASARLVLLLINHIGDRKVIDEAIERAALLTEA
ncbi:DUF2783 domain-containing protein [Aurantiacibacter flavus]|uniref:DUF2783 domain-containing protein n=1 Tax=Aurantiacibacter flavus TaxID=3145232 RepID=A0ABV0CVN2_9SPHN